jgi:hypothetical protein
MNPAKLRKAMRLAVVQSKDGSFFRVGGDSGVWTVRFSRFAQAWVCDCPALGACSHLLSVRLHTEMREAADCAAGRVMPQIAARS